MTLLDFVRHECGNDKDYLQAGAYNGLPNTCFGQYETFLKDWKEEEYIKDAFDEVVGCIFNDIEEGTWLYNFYNNLTIDKALEICNNIVIDNMPWPADFLYKGKSLCTHYGWPAEISPRYKRVADMLNTVQSIVKTTCDVAYMRCCEWLLEFFEVDY